MGQVIAKTRLPATGTAPGLARRPMSEIKCRNCSEMGHFARHCPKLPAGQGRRVQFLEDDLQQLHLDEDVEDGTYLLQTILEDVGAVSEGDNEEELLLVSVMGVVEAPEEQVWQHAMESTTAGLDPSKTWVEVKDGWVQRTAKSPVNDLGLVKDKFYQVLAEMAKVPGGRRALESYFSGSSLSSAYDKMPNHYRESSMSHIIRHL